MGRYYFHHRSNGSYIVDAEGSIHANVDEAFREAIDSAREIMRSQISTGRLDLTHQIEITGDAGVVLAILPIFEAVSAVPGEPAMRLAKAKKPAAVNGRVQRVPSARSMPDTTGSKVRGR